MTQLKPGDVVVMDAAGGGGYGDPRSRSRAALERDIAEGKVTLEAARREYALKQ
jgi:N-methylhydantoinase B